MGESGRLKEGPEQNSCKQLVPSQVVVADCRIFYTFATNGWHIGFQSLRASAAHNVDNLPSVDVGLPFNDGICQG